jgi:hypothetical protein
MILTLSYLRAEGRDNSSGWLLLNEMFRVDIYVENSADHFQSLLKLASKGQQIHCTDKKIPNSNPWKSQTTTKTN